MFVFSLYVIHKIKNITLDSSLEMFVLSYFLSCGKKSVFNLTLLQLLFDFHINGFYTILEYIFWKSLLALAQNKRTFNEKEKPDSHHNMRKSKVVLQCPELIPEIFWRQAINCQEEENICPSCSLHRTKIFDKNFPNMIFIMSKCRFACLFKTCCQLMPPSSLLLL